MTDQPRTGIIPAGIAAARNILIGAGAEPAGPGPCSRACVFLGAVRLGQMTRNLTAGQGGDLTAGQGGDAGGIGLRADLAVAALVGADLAGLTAQAMPVDGTGTAGSADAVSQLARDWWRAAGVTDVAAACEAAWARHDFDPVAQRALDRIRSEVLGRYGVDVREPGADPEAVRLALAERARFEHEAAVLDLADAAQAAARADAGIRRGEPDTAAAHLDQSDRLYRRAELRRRLAHRLESGLTTAAR